MAAFQAMKAVEVSVRAAAGLGDNLIGVKLMREAFAPEAGPLTDTSAEGGERVGGIGFGEQAIRGEGGNKVTTSIISKHRAIDREITAKINTRGGPLAWNLGTSEGRSDDLTLLTNKL